MENLQPVQKLLLWGVKLSTDVTTGPARKKKASYFVVSSKKKKKRQLTEGSFAQPHGEGKKSALRGGGK